ncbi:alpha-2-macroglobulin [Puteibacter caeruleilacunae]|nr:alpha-2-macroglobulin [Puteibacter caeruleilacunae]
MIAVNKFLLLTVLFIGVQFAYAQKKYDKLWNEVEGLELEGKFKSANVVVDKILSKAKRAKETQQITKSFIYKSKFTLLLEEEAHERVINELEATIKESAFPTNVLLESVYAGFLQQYLSRNRFKIQKRTKVEGALGSDDFEKWDLNTLVEQIALHYRLSLANSDKLKELPITDFKELLTDSKTSHKFRPTLFDFLAHRAKDFYKEKKWYLDMPKKPFFINDPVVFAPTKKFAEALFATQDSIYSNRNTLKIFQQLESFHEETNTMAYVDVALERLKFARDKAIIENKDDLYLDALIDLAKRLEGDEGSAIVNYNIAKFYYDASQQRNAKFDKKLKDYRIKAVEICSDVVDAYPNSDGGLLCEVLKNKIQRKSVSIMTEMYVAPDNPFLANVTFMGVDDLYVSAYKIPFNYFEREKHNKRDSLIKVVINNHKPIVTRSYKLQTKKDYYKYTTEVDFSGLSKGYYLILSSKTEKIKSMQEIFNHATLTVSNLSMISINRKKDYAIKLLERETGKPLDNVTVTVTEKKDLVKKGTTDELGEFLISKNKKFRRCRIVAVSKGDTLINSSEFVSSHYRREEKKRHHARMYLYLDRSIYRPGQTIYFKGLMVEKKDGKPNVVPDTYTSITIYDANNEELKEFRLKTNEYGSVSGEFKLPRNTRTGEFSIEMDEDYGTDDEDEDSFYDELDDVVYAKLEFLVEEYKRPRFEVVFNEMTDNCVVGDSIAVTGYAKAFLGANITEAQVNYTVTRVIRRAWGHRFFGGSTSKVIKTGSTTTDSDGKYSVDFVASPDSLTSKADKPVFVYTIKVDVTDSNGETHRDSKNVRVGYHNLEVDLVLADKLNGAEEQEVKINTTNLNNQPVDAIVEVAIEKLISPDRVLRKKPWKIVELNTLPKDKFIKLFPNEAYDSTDVKLHWKHGAEVFAKQFQASEDKIFSLDNISEWESGAYNVMVKAVDVFNDTVITNKRIEVYHLTDETIADNQLFDHTIVNTDYKKDGFVEIQMKTACKDLKVNLEAYYRNELVYNQLVEIKDGNETVKVPVSDVYKNKLAFNLFFVKFNSLKRENFSVNFKEKVSKLKIETISFRNKLIPGQKETWSFKITDADNNKANAEMLASMYDSSLDQFKKHSWRTNLGLVKPYFSMSANVNSGFFRTNTFRNYNWPKAYNTFSVLRKYHKLQWFGFDFGNPIYRNKRYLQLIAQKKKDSNFKNGNVYGIVTDDAGAPLPGTSVIIKGSTRGVITDIDGFYSINVAEGAELMFSFIGFERETVNIARQGTYNVVMVPNEEGLDEVVVVGFGKQKKEALVGAASAVASEDLAESLQGRVAGVDVQEGGQFFIRGTSSTNGYKKNPLFVVDGVPMSAAEGALLKPEDIVDFTILKDADAIALYGAQAQNGVIIITTKKGLAAMTQVETRNDLKETAFFYPHLSTNKKGEIIFSFDSPEALTKWRLMLFAHDKALNVGALEKTVVTQKNLNVIPNAPRFLREGDTITLSTKISNLTKDAMAGVAMLELYDGVTMNPIGKKVIAFEPTKSFTIAAKGNTAVDWKFSIPEGLTALQYKIVAKSGTHSDGEMNVLPVLTNRSLVTESRAVWVPAGETREVTFDNLKEEQSATQTNHKFTVEYTSNPAWVAIKSLPYLMEFPHECAEQVFSRLYANALAENILDNHPNIEEVFNAWKKSGSLKSALETNEDLKSVMISESPWFRDLQSDKENQARLANLFDRENVKSFQLQAISKLKELQDNSGGFPWFAGGNESVFITQHIVAGFGHLIKLDVLARRDLRIEPILKKALGYMDREFVERYERFAKFAKDTTDVSLSHYVLHYLYARSFFKDIYPISKKVKPIVEKYEKKCQTDWLGLSLYNKGLAALTLYRNGDKDTAKAILEALEEQTVIDEDGAMYWKENQRSWFWYQAPIETQSLLIEAYTEIGGHKKTVEGLKQWLLKNKRTNKWSTTKSTTEAIYALLMNGKDYLSMSDNTVITVGDHKIATKKLGLTDKEVGTGYFKKSWGAKDINADMATVKVNNRSKMTGYGGVYWQYFEDIDKVKSSGETPLMISKSLFLRKSTDEGEVLVPITSETPIKLGDMVTVRIEIDSKEDMEFVHLKDLRASGFEPVDVLSQYKWQDGLGYFQSTKDVATHFFFDRLPKGKYVFEYNLRANNKGNFSNGYSTIQSMYAPEFSSNSKGSRLEIK